MSLEATGNASVVPGSAVPTDVDIALGDVVRRGAAQHPDAPAVTAPGSEPLTYRRLSEQVELVRETLGGRLVEPGAIVATALPNGPEAAVAFLAFASIATVAPINPVLTGREVGDAFRRLRPRLVVVAPGTPRPVREAARIAGLPLVELEPRPGEQAGRFDVPEHAGSAGEAGPWAAPDDTALVLATSGTTGLPKLVPLTHRNVVAAAGATCLAHGLRPGDVRLNVMPLFHVQGLVGAVVAAVVSGGVVACAPGFEPERMAGWLDESGATWFSGSPTMHREILAAASRGIVPRAGTLRFVRAGSAALPARLRAELEDAFGLPVVESYGMTEAHQIASTPLPPGVHKAGTVGPPTGADVLVADASGEPQPIGEPGEILIQGPNVTPRYVDDDEANRAAFVRGWLRTGDVGFVDDDGYLTIVGRMKELINRGGEKVSPKEVEEAIAAHHRVREVAVFAVPDPVVDEDVGAAVVLEGDETLDRRELASFLKDRLAAFKRPRHVVFVDAIPRGPTGKIQRQRLHELLNLETATAPPRREAPAGSALETALSALWCDLLGVEEIAPDDDFFALGGDRLQWARLLERVRDAFRVEIAPAALDEGATTVAAMATLVERERGR
jgi:oxalate---CoA ligase